MPVKIEKSNHKSNKRRKVSRHKNIAILLINIDELRIWFAKITECQRSRSRIGPGRDNWLVLSTLTQRRQCSSEPCIVSTVYVPSWTRCTAFFGCFASSSRLATRSPIRIVSTLHDTSTAPPIETSNLGAPRGQTVILYALIASAKVEEVKTAVVPGHVAHLAHQITSR